MKTMAVQNTHTTNKESTEGNEPKVTTKMSESKATAPEKTKSNSSSIKRTHKKLQDELAPKKMYKPTEKKAIQFW